MYEEMSGLPKFRCGYTGICMHDIRDEVGFKDMCMYVQHVLILRLQCCSYNEQSVCFYGVAAGCCRCSSFELTTAVLLQEFDIAWSYTKKPRLTRCNFTNGQLCVVLCRFTNHLPALPTATYNVKLSWYRRYRDLKEGGGRGGDQPTPPSSVTMLVPISRKTWVRVFTHLLGVQQQKELLNNRM